MTRRNSAHISTPVRLLSLEPIAAILRASGCPISLASASSRLNVSCDDVATSKSRAHATCNAIVCAVTCLPHRTSTHARSKSSNGEVFSKDAFGPPPVSQRSSRANVAASARTRSLRPPPSAATPPNPPSPSLANSMKYLMNIDTNKVTFIALTGVERAFPLATLSCLAACFANLYNPPFRALFTNNARPYGRSISSSVLSLTDVIGSLTAFPISYQNTSVISGVASRVSHIAFRLRRSSPYVPLTDAVDARVVARVVDRPPSRSRLVADVVVVVVVVVASSARRAR